MKKYNSLFKPFLIISLVVSSWVSAYALTPTLSLSNSGTGDSVIVSVKGDPNSSVLLSYYSNISSGMQTQTIGTTDSTGAFWTLISTGAQNISSSGSVFVTINGTQSSSMVWPYVTTTSSSGSGTFSLSQTGLVLAVGQTSTLTATNASGMYLFNNTNPSVVNVSISGNQVNVSANSNGSTVFTICSGNSSNCASVYVTVQSNSTQLLTFSQSTVTVATGQTVPVSIYGGSGSYTIMSNSNAGVIQANISGSTLSLYGNSGAGQTSITVCTTDSISCGIINVTIGTTNSSSLSFSQTSPVITTGQTLTVTLSGSSGSYTISSNTNPSSVQANISGSTLNLYGSSYGSATIVVCSSTGSCQSLLATVSSGGGGGAISLNQSNLILAVGQTVGVIVSGGSVPYSLIPNTSSNVRTSLSGNIVTVTGVSAGSATVSVCSAGGGCIALSVIVNASGSGTTVSTTPGFNQSSVVLSSGQNTTVAILGSGGYYVAANSNSTVASASISGSNVVISGIQNGTTVLTICQSTAQCNTITVTVGTTNSGSSVTTGGALALNPIIEVGHTSKFTLSGGSNSYYNSSPVSSIFSSAVVGSSLTITGKLPGQGQMSICSTGTSCLYFNVTVVNPSSSAATSATPSTKHIFTTPLSYGSKGDEVIELQKRLHAEGYFNYEYYPSYGNLTVNAVKKYQQANGLDPLGNLGPATRALLNR